MSFRKWWKISLSFFFSQKSQINYTGYSFKIFFQEEEYWLWWSEEVNYKIFLTNERIEILKKILIIIRLFEWFERILNTDDFFKMSINDEIEIEIIKFDMKITVADTFNRLFYTSLILKKKIQNINEYFIQWSISDDFCLRQ